jgi:F-type H+-transporting ATPase subunit epsilon
MFSLEVLTPDGTTVRTDAESVSVPTTNGEITILPGHVPLISTLEPGMLTVRNGKEEQFFAVSRGVIQVDRKSIRILSDIADRVDTLDESAIEDARNRAEKLVSEKRHDAEGFAEATAILDRELARLRTVRSHRSRRRI